MTSFPYADRYRQQLALKGFDIQNQERLKQASVLVIGAGGLGCPALQCLAAMGIGHLAVADADRVSLSNLHRQFLYHEGDLGQLKAKVAVTRLRAANSGLHAEAYTERLTAARALQWFPQFDLILDCCDNFPTRYLINDACVLLHKPFISAAVYQYEGQLCCFDVREGSAQYRDLFPVMPSVQEAPDCATAGAYPVLTAVMGYMQAGEAVKYLSGFAPMKQNRFLLCNSLTWQWQETEIIASEQKGPADVNAFLQYVYDPAEFDMDALEPWQLRQLLQQQTVQLIDIREWDEEDVNSGLPVIRIPFSELPMQLDQLPLNQKIILICHAGIRSQAALELIQEQAPHLSCAHLKGGWLKWLHDQPDIHEESYP